VRAPWYSASSPSPPSSVSEWFIRQVAALVCLLPQAGPALGARGRGAGWCLSSGRSSAFGLGRRGRTPTSRCTTWNWRWAARRHNRPPGRHRGDRPRRPDRPEGSGSRCADPSELAEARSEGRSEKLKFGDQLIRRSGPVRQTRNCHGWVFTGGKFYLSPDDVEAVLKGQRLTPRFTKPQAGRTSSSTGRGGDGRATRPSSAT